METRSTEEKLAIIQEPINREDIPRYCVWFEAGACLYVNHAFNSPQDALDYGQAQKKKVTSMAEFKASLAFAPTPAAEGRYLLLIFHINIAEIKVGNPTKKIQSTAKKKSATIEAALHCSFLLPDEKQSATETFQSTMAIHNNVLEHTFQNDYLQRQIAQSLTPMIRVLKNKEQLKDKKEFYCIWSDRGGCFYVHHTFDSRQKAHIYMHNKLQDSRYGPNLCFGVVPTSEDKNKAKYLVFIFHRDVAKALANNRVPEGKRKEKVKIPVPNRPEETLEEVKNRGIPYLEKTDLENPALNLNLDWYNAILKKVFKKESPLNKRLTLSLSLSNPGTKSKSAAPKKEASTKASPPTTPKASTLKRKSFKASSDKGDGGPAEKKPRRLESAAATPSEVYPCAWSDIGPCLWVNHFFESGREARDYAYRKNNAKKPSLTEKFNFIALEVFTGSYILLIFQKETSLAIATNRKIENNKEKALQELKGYGFGEAMGTDSALFPNKMAVEECLLEYKKSGVLKSNFLKRHKSLKDKEEDSAPEEKNSELESSAAAAPSSSARPYHKAAVEEGNDVTPAEKKSRNTRNRKPESAAAAPPPPVRLSHQVAATEGDDALTETRSRSRRLRSAAAAPPPSVRLSHQVAATEEDDAPAETISQHRAFGSNAMSLNPSLFHHLAHHPRPYGKENSANSFLKPENAGILAADDYVGSVPIESATGTTSIYRNSLAPSLFNPMLLGDNDPVDDWAAAVCASPPRPTSPVAAPKLTFLSSPSAPSPSASRIGLQAALFSAAPALSERAQTSTIDSSPPGHKRKPNET